MAMTAGISGACKARTKEVINRTPKGGLVIEIGALVGHMAICALSQRPDIRWIMVDCWRAMDDQPTAYVETRDDHALHDAKRAMLNRQKAYENAGRVGASVIQMPSEDAAGLLAGFQADVVFIDADHSYEGCKRDIAAWTNKVCLGGWLGGHDFDNPDPRFGGVDRAVTEAFGDGISVGANYTWWVRK